MRKKAAQFLLSVLWLLLSFSSSAKLTTPPLPDFTDSSFARLSVAVDTAESATFDDAIDNVAYDDVPGGVRVVVVVFSDDPERGYVGIVDRSNNGAIWILYEGKLPLGLYELEVIGGKLSARHKDQSTWTDVSLLHGLGYDLSSIQAVLEHWEDTHSDFDDLTVVAMEARFAPLNEALFASVESDPRFVPGDSEGIAWLRQRLDDRKTLTVRHPQRGQGANSALVRHVAGSAGVMTVTGVGTGYDVSPQAAFLRLHLPIGVPKTTSASRRTRSASTQLSGVRIRLHHKGKLQAGKVSANRALSTTRSKGSASGYLRAGRVHRFDVPEEVFRQWELDGLVQPYRDMDIQSGGRIVGDAIDVLPPASGQLNQYCVPGEG